MGVKTLSKTTTEKICAVLSQERIILASLGKKPVDEADLDRLVADFQGLPAGGSVELIAVSPMDRTRKTLAAAEKVVGVRGAFRLAKMEVCKHLSEICLSRELTPKEMETILLAARKGQDVSKIIRGVTLYKDKLENRAKLTDIESIFDGGDSVLEYAQRTLQGQVALLRKANRKDREAQKQGIDDLAKTIVPPTKEQVAHMLYVQEYLKIHNALPSDACRSDLVYEPLMKAAEKVPDKTRFVVCRHAETDWVDYGLMTGGSVNLPLNERGKTTAILVGVMAGLLRVIDPARHEINVIGHSGGNALREAALCTVVPRVEQNTDGTYKSEIPHIIEKTGYGEWSVRALTVDHLEERLANSFQPPRATSGTKAPSRPDMTGAAPKNRKNAL